MAQPLNVIFVAGHVGDWRIERLSAVIGDGLPPAPRLSMFEGRTVAEGGAWTLHGVAGHPRYSTTAELKQLAAVSPPLGRSESTCAALIPIKKSDAWWSMGQDDRRAVFEDSSRHIASSMKHLPAVARRLHHARELGGPFDFLTWFEYSPDHARAFEQLVDELRASEEWRFVEREVDVRLARAK